MVYVFIIRVKVPVAGFINKAGNRIAVDVIREAVHVIPMVIFVSDFIECIIRQLQIGWVIRLGKWLLPELPSFMMRIWVVMHGHAFSEHFGAHVLSIAIYKGNLAVILINAVHL